MILDLDMLDVPLVRRDLYRALDIETCHDAHQHPARWKRPRQRAKRQEDERMTTLPTPKSVRIATFLRKPGPPHCPPRAEHAAIMTALRASPLALAHALSRFL